MVQQRDGPRRWLVQALVASRDLFPLTVFAISLGAPFWLDLLGNFMVLRGTVKPHAKSPEEGSKPLKRQPRTRRAAANDLAEPNEAANPAQSYRSARPGGQVADGANFVIAQASQIAYSQYPLVSDPQPTIPRSDVSWQNTRSL